MAAGLALDAFSMPPQFAIPNADRRFLTLFSNGPSSFGENGRVGLEPSGLDGYRQCWKQWKPILTPRSIGNPSLHSLFTMVAAASQPGNDLFGQHAQAQTRSPHSINQGKKDRAADVRYNWFRAGTACFHKWTSGSRTSRVRIEGSYVYCDGLSIKTQRNAK